MKKVFCLLAVVLSLTGCMSTRRDCASCGWHFEILKPPTLTIQTPVLVQGGQSVLGAHPVGAVAGPVTEGQFLHAPTPSVAPTAPPMRRLDALRSRISGNDCGAPCLSYDEWRALMLLQKDKDKSATH